MKLLSIHLPDSKPKDMGDVRGINLTNPNPAHYGWRVLVHGQVVFVIVPTLKEQPQGGGDERKAGTYEFGRQHCILRWSSRSPDDFKKPVQDYESEPLRAPGPEVVPEMDQPKAVAR